MPEPSFFIYKIQLTRPAILVEGPTPEEQEIMTQHAAYLEGLAEQGIALLVGRTLTTDSNTFGIAIFRADSPKAARQLMQDDPGVQAGIWHAEIFPFRISFLQPAWRPEE